MEKAEAMNTDLAARVAAYRVVIAGPHNEFQYMEKHETGAWYAKQDYESLQQRLADAAQINNDLAAQLEQMQRGADSARSYQETLQQRLAEVERERDEWKKVASIRNVSALQRENAEIQRALRLHLAVGPDDPLLVEPVEKQVVVLQRENQELKSDRDELSGRYADMMSRLKQLVKFYDDQNGTPCEQIRHAAEVDELKRENQEWRKYAADLKTDLLERERELAAVREAVVWALGYTDFRAREAGEGAYWWRTELRKRSGLTEEQIQQALARMRPAEKG